MSNYTEAFKRDIETLKQMSDDDEAAHCFEDELYHEFVDYVASGTLTGYEAKECAEILLTSKDISFARLCA